MTVMIAPEPEPTSAAQGRFTTAGEWVQQSFLLDVAILGGVTARAATFAFSDPGLVFSGAAHSATDDYAGDITGLLLVFAPSDIAVVELSTSR